MISGLNERETGPRGLDFHAVRPISTTVYSVAITPPSLGCWDLGTTPSRRDHYFRGDAGMATPCAYIYATPPRGFCRVLSTIYTVEERTTNKENSVLKILVFQMQNASLVSRNVGLEAGATIGLDSNSRSFC